MYNLTYLATKILFICSLRLLDFSYRLPLVLVLRHNVPSTFDKPEASQTLREFWGRWNRVIQAMLYYGIYKQIVYLTKSKRSSRIATFFGSGLLHILPVGLVTGDLAVCLPMFGFFLAQAIIIEFESRFQLSGPAWMAFCFISTSPLFIWPILEVYKR